jgi:hypothetical protein
MNIFAYLDPGTGSLILQAVVGGIVAVIIAVKAYWNKLVSKLPVGKSYKNSEDLREDKTN